MRALAAILCLIAGVVLADAPGQSLRPEARALDAMPESAVLEVVSRADTSVLDSYLPPTPLQDDTNIQVMVEWQTSVAWDDLRDPAPWTLISSLPSPSMNKAIELGEWPGLFVMAPQVRPVARDHAASWQNFLDQHGILISATGTAPRSSLVPQDRPELIEALARRQQRQERAGSVCGSLAIQGERIPDIAGRIGGCGVEDPVRVTSVSGVTLSTPATMDCPTAQALQTWIEQGVRPAVGNTGGGLSGLRVVGHYSCRTRNHQPGARISEHGKGRAIDIAGLLLSNGSEISLLQHWNDGTYGPILRQAHRAACGPFGTVLGPDADRFHRDHFHFDTARYRSGSYCR